MSIVAVQFRNNYNLEMFSVAKYLYYSNVDLSVGDIIVVPTKNGSGVVRVCQTDMKDSEIDERVKPYMLTIEEFVSPEDMNHVEG